MLTSTRPDPSQTPITCRPTFALFLRISGSTTSHDRVQAACDHVQHSLCYLNYEDRVRARGGGQRKNIARWLVVAVVGIGEVVVLGVVGVVGCWVW